MIYPEILDNGNLKLTVNDAAALADEDTIESALEVMLGNSIFNWKLSKLIGCHKANFKCTLVTIGIVTRIIKRVLYIILHKL